jgi:RNA polymerase sigma-70 factor (ECF subfamily)
MNSVEIDALIRRVQAGDLPAYDRVVAALQRDVTAFVAAQATSLRMIEEVVQEAFVRAFEHIADYDPRGTFSPWVKGIARNILRQQRDQRNRLVSADVEALEAALAAQTLTLDEDTVDDWRIRAAQHVMSCMDRLSPQAREIARRRFVHDIPLATLAQHFKRTRVGIACLLTRIRLALRTCLESRLASGRDT